MPGTSLPRTFEEWQRAVNRQLAENRRGPIQLIGSVREQVKVIEAATRRTPTNPVEITWQTAFYTAYTQNSGLNVPYTAVRLSVDFPDVTKATDGTDITVDRYELWGHDETPNIFQISTSAVPGKAVPGMTVPGLAKTDENMAMVDFAKPALRLIATSATSSFRAEDFIPGRTYKFYVRAMTLGEIQPGKLSNPFTVVMGKDETPPGQPTAPTVESDRGQLVVNWNGQAVGGAMPADFSYAVLAMGTESSPETEVARFGRGGGVYVATNLPYYEVMFFRVQAYDETGNKSAWSEQAFGYPSPLVDTDIILSEIDAAKTHLKNVDAGVSILENTIITEHLRITEDMAANIGSFMHLKAGNIDVNDLWADNAFFGAADARLIRSDMFIGKAFEGGTFTLYQGGKFQTDMQDNKGVKMTQTGIQAWNPSGTLTYDMSAATGDVVATGTFYTDLTGSRARLGDRDNIAALDLWADDTSAHGAMFTFLNGDGFYATQLTHFDTSSNTVPASFMQLRTGGITMKLGNYTGATNFIALTDEYLSMQQTGGYLTINENDAYFLHSGAGVGVSNPYMRLTQSERRFIMHTGTNPGNSSDYGFFQVVPSAVYIRQQNGHYIDMNQTYFTARVGPALASYIDVRLNTFELKMSKGSKVIMYADGNWEIGNSANVDGFGRGRVWGGLDEVILYATGSGGSAYNYMWLKIGVPTQFTGGMNVYGNFNCYNGTKNFVMPHPTKIGMELVHAATESPWSGIEYWDNGTLNEDGYWIVVLPEYFEAIAAQDHRLVKVFSPSGAPLTWTTISDGQFMIEGPAGAEFGWEVKARREGYDVEVERWVTEGRNAGEPRSPKHPDVIEGEAANVEDHILPHQEPKIRVGDKQTPGDERGSKPSDSNRNPRTPVGFRDYQLSRAGGRDQ